MGFLSLIALKVALSRLQVTVEPNRIGTFKGNPAKLLVRFRSRSPTWARISPPTVIAPFGVDCIPREADGETVEIEVRPRYSGLFKGLKVSSELGDALGLFHRTQVVGTEELVVESLPRSLLAPPTRIAVSPLTAGEKPAGRRGFGQELYGVEEYQAGLDARDILWRRVAAASDDRIPSRVREANVKESLRIGVSITWRSDEERVKRLDLVSEAIGAIGSYLLASGSSVEVIFKGPVAMRAVKAHNIAELGDACLAPSETVSNSEGVGQVIAASDLVILSPEQWPSASGSSGRRRFLFVSDGAASRPRAASPLVFTGSEDLSRIAGELLES